MVSKQIRLEILDLSYWEHFKFVQDLSRVLLPSDPRMIKWNKELHEQNIVINKLKDEIQSESTN